MLVEVEELYRGDAERTATSDPGTTGANRRSARITASDSAPTSSVGSCVAEVDDHVPQLLEEVAACPS